MPSNHGVHMAFQNRRITIEIVGGASRAQPDARDPGAGAEFRRRALFGGAGVLFGGILIGGLPRLAVSAPSAAQDTEVLNFALQLERLQEAFYAEAEDSLAATGELSEYIRVVGAHERAHRELIEKALGGDAEPAPELDFGDLFASPESFIDAAVALEETAVAAYNGQATNLTPEALATAARIASVEARHASWARGIAGEAPAPRGSDRAIGAARAQTELAELGLVTG
ncbi:MAG: ferritin-like domain-containing protein [Solirubrobacterales bacterium]